MGSTKMQQQRFLQDLALSSRLMYGMYVIVWLQLRIGVRVRPRESEAQPTTEESCVKSGSDEEVIDASGEEGTDGSDREHQLIE